MIYVAIGTVAYVVALGGIFALCRAAFLGDSCMSTTQRDAGSVPLPAENPRSHRANRRIRVTS